MSSHITILAHLVENAAMEDSCGCVRKDSISWVYCLCGDETEAFTWNLFLSERVKVLSCNFGVDLGICECWRRGESSSDGGCCEDGDATTISKGAAGEDAVWLPLRVGLCAKRLFSPWEGSGLMRSVFRIRTFFLRLEGT